MISASDHDTQIVGDYICEKMMAKSSSEEEVATEKGDSIQAEKQT